MTFKKKIILPGMLYFFPVPGRISLFIGFIYKGQAAQCQPGAACPIHIYFQILIQYIFTDFVKVRKAA